MTRPSRSLAVISGAKLGDLARFQGWLYAAVALVSIGVSFLYGPASVRMMGDHSIQLYAAQRMLHGQPPYLSALYVKTPMTPIATAAALAIGRPLGLGDALSSRIMFILLAGLAVFATCMAGSAILGALPWRLGSRVPVVGGLVAGAFLAGTSLLSTAAAMGLEPKLIVISFGSLSIWLAARRAWEGAGACAAVAFLAWQPSAIFGAAVVLAALLQAGQPRARTAARALLGVAAPLALVAGYLLLSGALPAAIRQAGLTPATFGKAVATNENLLTRTHINADKIWRIARTYLGKSRPAFLAGMVGWIVLAVLQPLWAGLRRPAGTGFLRRVWQEASTPTQVPLLVAGLGFGGFSLIDFQAGPDFLPLLPLAALGLAGLAALFVTGLARLRMPVSTVLLPLLVLAALILPAAEDGLFAGPAELTLQDQARETDKLMSAIGAATEVQLFGCLVPLVLQDRANATRFVHLGAKHLYLLSRELGTVDDLAALLIEKKVPVVVMAGQRVVGNPDLAKALAGAYEQRPLESEICPERPVEEIWVRRQP